MSKASVRLDYGPALKIAEAVCADLEPFAERIEIVGSLRRKSPTVGDIEILVIPKTEPVLDMFGGEASRVSLLDGELNRLAAKWGAVFATNGPAMKKFRMPQGITLEVCISSARRWPVEIVIKTGDKDFSRLCVTSKRKGGFLPSYAAITDGWQVYGSNGKPLSGIETEEDFLNFLELGWVKPENRNGYVGK